MFLPFIDIPNELIPYILGHEVTNDEITEEDNDHLINLALETFDYNGGNLDIKDPNHPWYGSKQSFQTPQTPVTDKLSKVFYKHMTETFSNLELIDERLLSSSRPLTNCNNIEVTDIYLSSKEISFPKNTWHNHLPNSTITMVYYPIVPDTTGTLSVMNAMRWEEFKSYDNLETEIKVYTRLMLVFPSWLMHRPNPPLKSNDPRICYNKSYMSLKRPVISYDLLPLYSNSEIGMFYNTYNPDWMVW